MSGFRLLLLIASFLFLIPSTVMSGITEHTLDNGMKVLIIEDRKAPLATFQIWYRVGSKDEPGGKSGISHLLEHMMFKGTPKYGSKAFSRLVQRYGGSDNAHTTKDYTMYYQTLSSDRIGLSFELESDRMVNLILDPKEVRAERDVVLEERRMRYDDDPQNLLYEDINAMSYKEHPYRRPVIGWRADIASIERDDLVSYYRKYYAPDKAFIVVAGDVSSETVLPAINRHFGVIPVSSEQIRKDHAEEPKQQGERRIFLNKEAELPYIMIAYHVPSFPHPDSFALEVLSGVLSEGKSSRMYRSLVYDRKIAINSFSDYSGLSLGPSLFFAGGTVAPGKTSGEMERAIDEEIGKLQESLPTEREILKTKNQIEASFIFAQDSNYATAYYTGRFELIGGWRLKDAYLEGIRKVTPEDVRNAARTYLRKTNRTVGILVPQKTGGS